MMDDFLDEDDYLESQNLDDVITDGHGNWWPRLCPICGDDMQIMRPGDCRCIRCYDEHALDTEK